MRYHRATWRSGLMMLCVTFLGACAHPPQSVVSGTTRSDEGARVWRGTESSAWREIRFPGKAATQYRWVKVEGQAWLSADAQRSASMLRHALDREVGPHSQIRFEWRLEQTLQDADVARRDKEDSPARVILAFDGDRSEFSARDAALSELSHLMTGEPMPYATLMYVWCPHREVGTVVHNPRTDRIRKLVVANPNNARGRVAIERQIQADYEQAFGQPPGRLIGVAIMTDSDNTQGRARTLYGPIEID
ncbi:MAG: DUF3047 domain-containing protein [Alphaproteobacteria bacterium]|nr:DUF3047 domain-containing protein [Alphaproteobacteria bacterium]